MSAIPIEPPPPHTSTVHSPSDSMQRGRRPKEDCLSCRLIGASAFTGLGGYALFEAYRRGTFNTVRPPKVGLFAGKVQAVVGFVFISLGIGRLVM